MKKNKAMRLACALMILTMLSTCCISGTFAKYTSAVVATADTVTVAKWDIDVTDGTNSIDTKFDLFKDSTDDKIAPGSSGSFSLVTTNKSEVAATYTVALTETNAGKVPITYTYKIGNGDATALTFTDGVATIDRSATTLAVSGSETITISWAWASTSDEADTAFGTATTLPTVSVGATVTANQHISSK